MSDSVACLENRVYVRGARYRDADVNPHLDTAVPYRVDGLVYLQTVVFLRATSRCRSVTRTEVGELKRWDGE